MHSYSYSYSVQGICQGLYVHFKVHNKRGSIEDVINYCCLEASGSSRRSDWSVTKQEVMEYKVVLYMFNATFDTLSLLLWTLGTSYC